MHECMCGRISTPAESRDSEQCKTKQVPVSHTPLSKFFFFLKAQMMLQLMMRAAVYISSAAAKVVDDVNQSQFFF